MTLVISVRHLSHYPLLMKICLEIEYQIKGALENKVIDFWVFILVSSACWTRHVLRRLVPLGWFCFLDNKIVFALLLCIQYKYIFRQISVKKTTTKKPSDCDVLRCFVIRGFYYVDSLFFCLVSVLILCGFGLFRVGLYRGWFPVVTALCCSNFVYFYTFNSLKLKMTGGRKSSPLIDLSLAFVSGAVVFCPVKGQSFLLWLLILCVWFGLLGFFFFWKKNYTFWIFKRKETNPFPFF